jgi:hypothetical protein
MKMHVKQGSNIFCGPAAISAIVDISTDEAARVINEVRGFIYSSPPVTGVHIGEMQKAFNLLGYSMKPFATQGMSLYRTLFSLKEDGYYLLMPPRHYIVIKVEAGKKYLCDNHTKEEINAAASARLQQFISHIWKITERKKVFIPEPWTIPVVLGHGCV